MFLNKSKSEYYVLEAAVLFPGATKKLEITNFTVTSPDLVAFRAYVTAL